MRNEQLNHYVSKIQKFLERLQGGAVFTASAPLTAEYASSQEPVAFSDRLSLTYKPISRGEKWGDAWDSAWFKLSGKVPGEWAGKKVVAHLNFNGEACVFDDSGCPRFGLTNGSVFAVNYGKDVHYLFDRCAGNETVELWVEAAANHLFGINLPGDPKRDAPQRHGEYEGRVIELELAVFDDEVWGLMLDVQVLLSLFGAIRSGAGARGDENSWGSTKTIPEATPRAKKILRGLHAALVAYGDDPQNAAAARAVLRPLFASPANASDIHIAAVGHAHIDTGWMWPVRESVRKVARTFSSQIALMEKYPGYIFGASQPQLYAFARDHYPQLFAKIKEWVKHGNWELQGGMWVEADCNVTGGEAMVRQFVHGKNFYMDEFGIDVRNLWLPDVFGYSAALPQIMKQCGVDYFLTQKISWGQFNQFPFNTFRWRGIDGTEILTHFPPEDTYNSFAMPDAQVKAQNNFKENDRLDDMMCLYGIGNGGGGPKEEYVERVLRMENLEGCPPVKFGRADDFFRRIAEHTSELELWDGELYLELHRATLTTQARTKKGNRDLEHALRAAEFICAALPDYPRAALDRLWKKLLINQFHDILPGSSIHKVYETTEREHAESIAECRTIIASAAARLGGAAADNGAAVLTLVNTLPFAYTAPVALPADWANCTVTDAAGQVVPAQSDAAGTVVCASIPACGTLTLRKGNSAAAAQTTNGLILENEKIKYEFRKDGTIASAWDKELGREFIENGRAGNAFALYVDRSVCWDAWDIDVSYEHEQCDAAHAAAVEQLAAGPVRQGLKFTLTIGQSVIEQEIYLNAGSKRLDFITRVDWQEYHKMLRVSFPVTVRSPEAAFDIQYGYVKRPTHRNTSWDMAKFEVVAHQYADLSCADFGAAVLNDCKYGYKVLDNVLDLNLLRASTNPDADADRGNHTFTYSFLPHAGALTASDVQAQAAMLNFPPVVLPGVEAGKFVSPVTVEGEGITLGALKCGEKEDCTVIRIAETAGRHGTAKIKLNHGEKLIACDMLEWHDGEESLGKEQTVELAPFAIKTFKIR